MNSNLVHQNDTVTIVFFFFLFKFTNLVDFGLMQ